MNSQMEANVADGVSSIFSEEAITSTHLINQKNAERSKLFLSMATLLGLYVMVATLVLAIKASNPPGLLTFLNDHISSAQLVTPHRNPPVTDRQAIHWARDRVCDLLSLHFKKYSDQVSRRKSYFAGDGWLFYQQSLMDNNVIKTIKEEGLIITAINQGTPRLLQKYRLDGKINWRIEMPILQTIQGASDTPETVRKVVSVTVEESRRDESIEGLKIRVFGVIE